MADSAALTDAERTLLEELLGRKVRFLVVGMSAALLQGARGSTEDIDLWFGMGPPRIGGDALGDRFDVVTTMSGLPSFAAELAGSHRELVDGLELPVLPLERILHSKRAAGRPKDLAAIPSIEDALAILRRGR